MAFLVVMLVAGTLSVANDRNGWGFLGTATGVGIGLLVKAVLLARRRRTDRGDA
jgi:uncharacterized membrane protein YgaE (UPF0421/DUF939 family)